MLWYFLEWSIFRLFESFVFIAQKGAFSFQNIVKDIFQAYIGYKEKLEKCPFLDQNHWLIPLEKCQFLDFLKFLILQVRKAVFLSQNFVKQISLAYVDLKEQLEKSPFLDQNQELTPLEKCQFFDFLNFFFLQLRKAFFVLKYRKRRFAGLYCLKRKVGKMAFFGPKPWVNAFGKVSIFRLFELFVFIAQKGVFCSRIS